MTILLGRQWIPLGDVKVMETALIVLSVLIFIYLSIRYGIALLIWWGKRT